MITAMQREKKKRVKSQLATDLLGVAVAIDSKLFPTGAHSLCQVLQNKFRVFPVDAGVGDTDTVLEAGLALGRNLLVACCGDVSGMV